VASSSDTCHGLPTVLARPGPRAAGRKTRRKLHPLPILSNLEDLLAHVPEPERARPGLLALDVSKRAIGVAESGKANATSSFKK
jgi:hypothetical protein